MKAKKMVHGSYARTILTEEEASRLRRAGWLEVTDGKAVTKDASWQRRFRQKCKNSGLRQLLVWIPEEVFLALMAKKREGETTAQLIARLVKVFGLTQ